MLKNVVGLDLGSHSIKAVEFRQTLRGLEPAQLRVHPSADDPADLPELLRHFFREYHLSAEHVVAAVPGDKLSSRRLEFPFRDRKKLAAAVPFEVEGEVPFAIEELLVAWEAAGGDRTHATVAAAIAQRKQVGTLLAELAEANCEPRVLEAEGFALANLCALFDLEGTRLIADIGHRKTSLCLLIDGTAAATRTVPVGGRAITQAIARDRNLGVEEAERVKCEEGIFQLGFNSNSPGSLAIVDRIAREIIRTIESLEAVIGGAADAKVSGITLVGGSAKLHRLDEYLSQRTGIPAATLGFPPEEEGAALVAGGDPVLFAPAIALALRGTARARTKMDFRQNEFAYRTDLRQLFGKEWRPTFALAAVVFVLMLASIAASITLDTRRARALEARVGQIYAEAFPGEEIPDNPIAAMREAARRARERADFLGVYGGDRSALDLLAELSRRIPEDLDVKFEEVSIDRKVIRIKAFAKTFEAADRLEQQLAESDPFLQAKIDGEVRAERRREGKTFDVTIPLPVPGESS